MEIKINNAMDIFLKNNFHYEGDNEKYLEKYFTKIIMKNKMKICPRYKLCSGRIKKRERIWYTKDFNYKYKFLWRNKVRYKNKIDLMKYEFEGNEIYFENTNNIKNCFLKAIKVYSQLVFQMNKIEEKFVTFLQLVEVEDESGQCGWNIQIRFYSDRKKKKDTQTLWGNIEEFINPTLWIYI